MVKLKREEEVIMTEKKVVKKVVEKKEPVKKVAKATVKEVAAAPEVKETVVKAPEPAKEKAAPVKKARPTFAANTSLRVFARSNSCLTSFQKPTPSSMPEMAVAIKMERVGMNIVCKPPP